MPEAASVIVRHYRRPLPVLLAAAGKCAEEGLGGGGGDAAERRRVNTSIRAIRAAGAFLDRKTEGTLEAVALDAVDAMPMLLSILAGAPSEVRSPVFFS